MKISDLLLEKARYQKLAHFYIIESATKADPDSSLQKFTHDFLRDYFQKIEGHKQTMAHLMDHPDVFVLGNTGAEGEPNDKLFKVEEAEALTRFFEFRPVQGKRKFAVITEGHRISPTVANKWLKLFEEPQGNSTIILLNPRRVQLLPTIHSRAIHLRLPAEGNEQNFSNWNDFVGEAKNLSLASFLENYRDQNLSYWINELIRWESEQVDQAGFKEKMVNWLKTFQEMEVFHQPTATKWSLFYFFLRDNVFPRLK